MLKICRLMVKNAKKWLPLQYNCKYNAPSERAKVTIKDQLCGKLEQKSHWDSIS
jgi:hypothetical protein